MSYLMLYAVSGLVAGFFGGLVGIGGGVILVPVLVVLFSVQGVAEPVIMPLALGTSLASIAFTSISSMSVHHAKGAVDWQTVRDMTPGIVGGALISSALAAYLAPATLKVIFALYVGIAATQLVCDFRPPAARSQPSAGGLSLAGGVIGAISGLSGVGGASTSLPFLLWCNVPARVAIGTTSALGLPIAIAGTLGYIGHGLSVADLPRFTLGYIHLPALAAIVAAALISAPLGARASHRLPVPMLRKVLAALLYSIMVRSLVPTS